MLVRYSGTEPLLRIMIEGEDQASVQAWAEEIADAVSTATMTLRLERGIATDFDWIHLSVNVNKVATLRNSRGGACRASRRPSTTCLEAGAPGITVHPRADERHIRASDVREVAAELAPSAVARARPNSTSRAIRVPSSSTWCSRRAPISARSCR